MQVLKVGDKYLSIDGKLLSTQNSSGVVTITTAGDSTSRVVSGAWSAASIPNANGGSF